MFTFFFLFVINILFWRNERARARGRCPEETTKPAAVPGWEDGKVFSCTCGGDAHTDPFCKYQADTTFLFHMVRSLQ